MLMLQRSKVINLRPTGSGELRPEKESIMQLIPWNESSFTGDFSLVKNKLLVFIKLCQNDRCTLLVFNQSNVVEMLD